MESQVNYACFNWADFVVLGLKSLAVLTAAKEFPQRSQTLQAAMDERARAKQATVAIVSEPVTTAEDTPEAKAPPLRHHGRALSLTPGNSMGAAPPPPMPLSDAADNLYFSLVSCESAAYHNFQIFRSAARNLVAQNMRLSTQGLQEDYWAIARTIGQSEYWRKSAGTSRRLVHSMNSFLTWLTLSLPFSKSFPISFLHYLAKHITKDAQLLVLVDGLGLEWHRSAALIRKMPCRLHRHIACGAPGCPCSET